MIRYYRFILPQDKIDEFFAGFDKDKNGQIDFDEFLTTLRPRVGITYFL